MKKFAFVFPGQGSQSVGMLDAWGDHPSWPRRCRGLRRLGEDVGADPQGPKEALALTTNTQPVMLVAGVAAWRVWRPRAARCPRRGRPFAG
jgi:[acyl-carrier-protein] S-malonyltransferase